MDDDFEPEDKLSLLVDELGNLVEMTDNYLAYSANPFMEITQLKDIYRDGLEKLHAQLFELYIDFGGEDVWNEKSD